jgi:hypothetical protein
MVCNTFAAVHSGIHWSILPLLSHTADKKSKLNTVAIQDNGAVVAIDLNFYRTLKQGRTVIKSILSLPPNTYKYNRYDLLFAAGFDESQNSS